MTEVSGNLLSCLMQWWDIANCQHVAHYTLLQSTKPPTLDIRVLTVRSFTCPIRYFLLLLYQIVVTIKFEEVAFIRVTCNSPKLWHRDVITDAHGYDNNASIVDSFGFWNSQLWLNVRFAVRDNNCYIGSVWSIPIFGLEYPLPDPAQCL